VMMMMIIIIIIIEYIGSAVDVSVSHRPIIFDRSVLVCFQSLI